jgi:hypothetical protein
MPMTDQRLLTLDELHSLADRLDAASRSIRLARPLRADLLLAARIFDVLLRTRTLDAPLACGDGCACTNSSRAQSNRRTYCSKY